MNHSQRYVEQVIDLMGGTPQVKFWKKLYRKGRSIAGMDRKDSAAISEIYKCEPRMCFQNAAKVAIRNCHYRYMEGIGTNIIPTEHAWLIDERGNVVDPTWVLLESRRRSDYFGVEIPAEFAVKHYGGKDRFIPAWVVYLERRKQ